MSKEDLRLLNMMYCNSELDDRNAKPNADGTYLHASVVLKPDDLWFRILTDHVHHLGGSITFLDTSVIMQIDRMVHCPDGSRWFQLSLINTSIFEFDKIRIVKDYDTTYHPIIGKLSFGFQPK